MESVNNGTIGTFYDFMRFVPLGYLRGFLIPDIPPDPKDISRSQNLGYV